MTTQTRLLRRTSERWNEMFNSTEASGEMKSTQRGRGRILFIFPRLGPGCESSGANYTERPGTAATGLTGLITPAALMSCFRLCWSSVICARPQQSSTGALITGCRHKLHPWAVGKKLGPRPPLQILLFSLQRTRLAHWCIFHYTPPVKRLAAHDLCLSHRNKHVQDEQHSL